MNKTVKVGIMTMVYKSINPGGVLQAYALTKWINQQGYDCKQIQYNVGHPMKRGFSLKTVKGYCKSLYLFVLRKLFFKTYKKRQQGFQKFKDERIPHTIKVYNRDSLQECSNNFDIYVAGSDQIWNSVNNEMLPYYLDFVNPSCRKVAYAPSMTYLPDDADQQAVIKGLLIDFASISVRETTSEDYLKSKIGVQAQTVVDPVFLINSSEWEELLVPRIVNQPYYFTYELGNNQTYRNHIRTLANKNDKTVVFIKHASGIPHKDTHQKNDIVLDITEPRQFLSLIKYADAVFTDSFHAAAFSVIFNKDFYVFERKDRPEMMIRLSCLMDMTNTKDRIINENKLIPNDYSTVNYILLNEIIANSKEYLKKALQ